MATINNTPAELNKVQYMGPHGNLSASHFSLVCASDGKVNGVAVATADKIIVGQLQSGMKLYPADFTMNVSDAFTASATLAVGFEYQDGVDDAAVPQDADYFLTATTGSLAVQRGNNTGVKPITLPKAAFLIATVAGAALDAAARADLVVKGEMTGQA